LVSPYIKLPTISPDEYIKLKFWYWFRINRHTSYSDDHGWIQISVNGGNWQTLAGPFKGFSPVWTQGYVDLSAFVDSTVRIAFYLISGSHENDIGWYIDDVRIEGISPTFPLTVSIDDGWNMVSIPGLHPLNQDVDTWWPGLTGGVFKFSGGYVPVDTAETGEGYWMKHTGDTTYNYHAIEVLLHDPIVVDENWNMVGCYEEPVPVSGITPSVGTVISVFGYSGGYTLADTLVPGVGYWINVSDSGNIILTGGPAPLAKGSGEYFKEDWGKIIITDNAGRSYTKPMPKIKSHETTRY